MKELFCTKCEQVIGTVELSSPESYDEVLSTYKASTRCDNNDTEEVSVGVDAEGNALTQTVGSLAFREAQAKE